MHWLAWGWGACTYVTSAEYEAQLLQRDEDEDGITVGEGDCDDRNATVGPGFDEIEYDGLDNDCAGDGDEADVDNDGRAAEVVGGDDCDDDDETIAPGMPDEPYDGIDSDCGRDNDFDADGDGFVNEGVTQAQIDAYKAASGATFAVRFGDCNDMDDTIFPESPAEVPYDGVDSDCDGADDFDVDGDGSPWPDDCLDQPDAAINADPADVFPGADDPPYDGIDANCVPDNEFDLDGDGFVSDETPNRFDTYLAYEATYGLSFGSRPGDCDDTEPAVNPEGLERFGDGLDANCDDDADRSTFALSAIDVVGPEAVRLDATAGGFVVAVSAEQITLGAQATANAVATALLAPDLGAGDDPIEADVVLGPLTTSPGAALSLTPTPSGIALGHAYDDGTSVVTTIGARSTEGTVFGPFSPETLSGPALGAPVAAHLVIVDTDARLVTCAGNDLILVTSNDLATASLGSPLTTCFHEPDGGAVGCQLTTCTTFDVTPSPPSLDNPVVSPVAVAAARQRDGIRVEVRAGVNQGARLVRAEGDTDVLVGHTVLRADAVEDFGEIFVAAVTRNAAAVHELRVVWGTVDSLTTYSVGAFDPARPDLEPLDVAIAANAERVVIGVTLSDGTNDAVGWTVYERP